MGKRIQGPIDMCSALKDLVLAYSLCFGFEGDTFIRGNIGNICLLDPGW